jgi:hypothetical protein
MKVVVDMNNVVYYEGRAIECIYQAQALPEGEEKYKIEQLRQAVGLLLLALVKRNGQIAQEVQEGSRNSASSGEPPPAQ